MKDTFVLEGVRLRYADEPAPDKRDELERVKILNQFSEILPMLEENNDSRRCVATFMTEHEGQLTYACPSLVHIFVEDNKVCIKTYFRSLHISNNFEFDKNTMRLLLQLACERLNLQPGFIKIFVGCPHGT